MEKNNSTISISIPNPMVGVERVRSIILNSSINFYNGPIKSSVNPTKNIFKSIKNPFKDFKFPRFNRKLLLRLALPVLVVLIFVLGAISLIRNFNTTSANLNGVNQAIVIPDATAKIDLNRNFTFPLRDEEGEEVGRFNYVIENAELRKQIIVKGQRATSIEGRIFLILNLKITNSLNQGVSINTRDYIRVIVNNDKSELLAPDIHNDPVEVQAISTKYTRVGLAINEADAKSPITIQVGEIGGEKQSIEISLK